jgi:hypothetical protein
MLEMMNLSRLYNAVASVAVIGRAIPVDLSAPLPFT